MATAPSPPKPPPKLIITPGSPHHNDLSTFLTYAERVNLSPKSPTYVGTHYEYTVATTLLRLGFSLIRTGRRADNGIDLLGHWAIPTLPEPLPVLIQCKAHKTNGPHHVRELEGAFAGVPVEWRRRDVLGLLVTTQKATRGVLEMIGMNRWPMGFLKVTKKGVVEQFVWNRSAVERGLEGVGVTVRYRNEGITGGEVEDDVKEEKKEAPKAIDDEDPAKRKRRKARKEKIAISKDIQLTWLGKPIFAVRDSLDEKTVQLREEISSANTKVEGEGKRKKPGPKKKYSEAISPVSNPSPLSRKASIEASKAKPPARKVGRPKKLVVEKILVKTRAKKVAASEEKTAKYMLAETRAKISTASGKTTEERAPAKTRVKESVASEKKPGKKTVKTRAKRSVGSEEKIEKETPVKPRSKKGVASKEEIEKKTPSKTRAKKGVASGKTAT